ncbi:tyrosylprotein sulfotransferase 1, like [Trichomycterus rosablanca]|uniref:tyrosylprotein sulfotransferase 1, like n=1 Tax=Trichomycterus rosablanca TaxID=2290929 RepID=UPI002F34F219
MRKQTCNVLLAFVVISSITMFYLSLSTMECRNPKSGTSWSVWSSNQRFSLNRSSPLTGENIPLIFVGGVPRSGTTLMRAMLDAHPEVRCGEETRVIPRLLALQASWSRSSHEKMRLNEAGVTDEVLDSAIRAFLLEIIVGHGEPAPRLCNKDPFALKSLTYLSKLFPNAKFVLMLRDGRATVHSMISRKVTITGFDLTSYRDCLVKWNRAVEVMYEQCQSAPEGICLPVHYEQLVLNPEKVMQKLVQFLKLPWDQAVLHHEQLIGKAGGVSLSKLERSTDQVFNPVNTEALSKWVGNIPDDVVKQMAEVAPMLKRLGYDPLGNPPNYNKLKLIPLRNPQLLKEAKENTEVLQPS